MSDDRIRQIVYKAARDLGLDKQRAKQLELAVAYVSAGAPAEVAADDGTGAIPGSKSPDPTVPRGTAAISHARMVFDEYAGRATNFPDSTGVVTMLLLAELLEELRLLRGLVKERL